MEVNMRVSFKSIPYPLKTICNVYKLHSPITGQAYTARNSASVDHIIPRIKGGTTREDNLWIVDRFSNTDRSDQRLDKYFKRVMRRNKSLPEFITASFQELVAFAPKYVDEKIPIISRYLGQRIRI